MDDLAIWLLGVGVAGFVVRSLTSAHRKNGLHARPGALTLAVAALVITGGCDVSSLFEDAWSERHLQEFRAGLWLEAGKPAYLLEGEVAELEKCAVDGLKALAPGFRAYRRLEASKRDAALEEIGRKCFSEAQLRVLQADTWASNYPLVYEHNCRLNYPDDEMSLKACLCLATEARNHFESPKAFFAVDTSESIESLTGDPKRRWDSLERVCAARLTSDAAATGGAQQDGW